MEQDGELRPEPMDPRAGQLAVCREADGARVVVHFVSARRRQQNPRLVLQQRLQLQTPALAVQDETNT